LRALATDPAARGLEDDAAVLTIGGETLVVTQDTLLSGIHIREDEDPADIAWKLVAVNLSDLAAKGAVPVGMLVTHMLGQGDERFVAGLGEVLREYEVPLLGGDTVSSGGERRSWTGTALGRATHTPVPDRCGARPGDAIYVTGKLGLAMLGLDESERNTESEADLAYRRPRPLLAEGRALSPHVTAMMDVSDGLLLDCQRMARASGTTFHLDRRSFPVADAERANACVRWGDDYQLLFTASPDTSLPVSATRIGLVGPGHGAALRIDGAVPADGDLGYQHR
jgi:thiamine-monophosphate kinase